MRVHREVLVRRTVAQRGDRWAAMLLAIDRAADRAVEALRRFADRIDTAFNEWCNRVAERITRNWE